MPKNSADKCRDSFPNSFVVPFVREISRPACELVIQKAVCFVSPVLILSSYGSPVEFFVFFPLTYSTAFALYVKLSAADMRN